MQVAEVKPKHKVQTLIDFQNFEILKKLAFWIQAFSYWPWIYWMAGDFRVDEIQSANAPSF